MPVLLTSTLVLGAIGLFLALPGKNARVTIAGLGLFIVAVACGLGFGIGAFLTNTQAFVFGVLSAVAVLAAVRVITHTKPVYSALYFVLIVVATAGLLIQMNAEFLAVALIMIYAGAILVTYVFVIMLAQRSGGPTYYDRSAREPFWGVLGGVAVLTAISTSFAAGAPGTEMAAEALAASNAVAAAPADTAGVFGGVYPVGVRLVTHYIVAIQLAGVLLLAAMVGAIAIARRKADTDPYDGAYPVHRGEA